MGPKREVKLYRRADRGFGFSLRRSTISERDQTRHTVLFAEPGSVGCGLLPGDRLLEIDGHDVVHAPQEAAVARIKAAGDFVTLTVQGKLLCFQLSNQSTRKLNKNKIFMKNSKKNLKLIH